MTSFHKREYDVQFWVGHAGVPPPWTTQSWPALRPAFDRLVSAGRRPIKLHSSQIDSSTGKHVHFGRLAWSVESDIKWIIDSPDARHFENIEMWAPGRGTCERENRSPDTYFDLTKMYSAAGYEWFAVAALACEIPEPNRRQILLQIHAAFSAVFPNLWSALGHRPWGYDWGEGFGDGMQELSDSVSWNLNKTNGIFNLELLRGKWSLARAA